MSNVCGQKSNDHNKEKITTDPYSNMNTEDESTKNNTIGTTVQFKAHALLESYSANLSKNQHPYASMRTDCLSNLTENLATQSVHLNHAVLPNPKLVFLRSIGGTHTSNTASIKNKDLDRVWLEHFARAIYKNGLLNDRQYKKLLSMIDRELARMYHKAA